MILLYLGDCQTTAEQLRLVLSPMLLMDTAQNDRNRGGGDLGYVWDRKGITVNKRILTVSKKIYQTQFVNAPYRQLPLRPSHTTECC